MFFHHQQHSSNKLRNSIIFSSCLLLFIVVCGFLIVRKDDQASWMKDHYTNSDPRIFLLGREEDDLFSKEHSIKSNPSFSSRTIIKKSKCTIHFLIMTAPRENLKLLGHSPFMYLNRTMDSILNLETLFFQPCMTLLNVKGVKFRKELEQLAFYFETKINGKKKLSTNENFHQRITIIDLNEQSQHNLLFTSVLLPLKKKQHLNDFYSIFNQIKLDYLDQMVMIMEDDFIMCPGASQHLLYIIHEMEKRKWSGVRVSFGLNGVMLNGNDLYAMVEFLKQHGGRATPVDWLLEEFWNQYDSMGMNYFGKTRKFYTYRLQLMEHIGFVSSVGNLRQINQNDLDFPHCYEAQIAAKLMFHFNMDQCSHSMFSPCDNDENVFNSEEHGRSFKRQFAHDQFNETLGFSPSSMFSLAHFKTSVKAILCQEDESCDHCCLRNGKKCDSEYFPYINHCSELRKYKPNCDCQREKYLISRAPYMVRNTCFIGTRRSRFDCTTSKAMSSRLCPCA